MEKLYNAVTKATPFNIIFRQKAIYVAEK